jgi:hypothetical protein
MLACTWEIHTHLYCVVGEVKEPETQDECGGRAVPRPSVIPAQIIYQLCVIFFQDFGICCYIRTQWI